MWCKVATVATSSKSGRPTQADRRARTRGALLEAAAQGLSRDGYANLVLERVAREAGYTRGALYHLFANKEDLALAVVAWVEETWYAEVGHLLADNADPVGALIAVARGHAVLCRRDVARVMTTLSVEFSGQDHPVGRAVKRVGRRLVADCTRLITTAARLPASSLPANSHALRPIAHGRTRFSVSVASRPSCPSWTR